MDPHPSPLLSSAQLARLLGVSLRTVERWRQDDTGPPYVTLGRRVMYRPVDVWRWVADQVSSGPWIEVWAPDDYPEPR